MEEPDCRRRQNDQQRGRGRKLQGERDEECFGGRFVWAGGSQSSFSSSSSSSSATHSQTPTPTRFCCHFFFFLLTPAKFTFLRNCFDAAALHPLIRPVGTWEDRFPALLRKNKRGTSWEIIGEHGLGTPDFFSLKGGDQSTENNLLMMLTTGQVFSRSEGGLVPRG